MSLLLFRRSFLALLVGAAVVGCASYEAQNFKTSGYVFEKDKPAEWFLSPQFTSRGKIEITKVGMKYGPPVVIGSEDTDLSGIIYSELRTEFARTIAMAFHQAAVREGLPLRRDRTPATAVARFEVAQGRAFCTAPRGCTVSIEVHMVLESPSGARLWEFSAPYASAGPMLPNGHSPATDAYVEKLFRGMKRNGLL